MNTPPAQGGCTVSVSLMWVSEKVLRNGKPTARSGRKATGLSEMAGLPKLNQFRSDRLSHFLCVRRRPIVETKMKKPSELRVGNRAGTHRNWHCRRSVFRFAVDATFPPVVSNPKSLPMRQMRSSILRKSSNKFGDRSTRNVFGDARLAKVRFKVELSGSPCRRDHLFWDSLHNLGLEEDV